MLDPTPPDRQVVDAVLAGDRDAFRPLVERESAMVIAACRRVVGNTAEAEDVAQEAFTRAYVALASFRGDGPFGAWIRRIAIRIAVERLAASHAALSLDDERFHERVAHQAGNDPEVRLIDIEERAALIDAVGHLPADQRQAVMLRFFGDRSVEEIARLTDRPIGTIKSRLSRGVASLRDQFGVRSAP
ncbi:MAG TPA: sigma-70 family RNA polymerase sigma factor [Candidatus Limnocylindrales bacterium]